MHSLTELLAISLFSTGNPPGALTARTQMTLWVLLPVSASSVCSSGLDAALQWFLEEHCPRSAGAEVWIYSKLHMSLYAIIHLENTDFIWGAAVDFGQQYKHFFPCRQTAPD